MSHHTIAEHDQLRQQRQAFTIAEFAAAYRIGRTRIWEEVRAGRLKARKSGRRVLILISDAHEWAQNLPVA